MLIYICFQNNGALQLEQNASPSLSILTADDGCLQDVSMNGGISKTLPRDGPLR
jgi:hypothetical protein